MGKDMSTISAHSSLSLSIAFNVVFLTQISNHSSKYSFGTQSFIHFKFFVSHIFLSTLSFHGIVVFSLGSSQFIMLYKNAASLTVFVIVQGQSKLDAIGIIQYLEFLP
jgi:hypothetical protein